MFKVIVLACAFADPSVCWEFIDTRGPYPRRDQCTARAYEMGNAILEIERGELRPQSFKCVLLKGQEL